MKLQFERLESRDTPTLYLYLGEAVSVAYPESATVTQSNSVTYSIVATERVVVHTPKYASAVFVGNTGTILVNGWSLTVTSPDTYVYNVGGLVYWLGTDSNESVVQVSQSYMRVNSQAYCLTLVGFDQHTMNGGGGTNDFYLYGSNLSERLTFNSPSTFYVTHRDGYDNFVGFAAATFRGQGGTDLVLGTKPSAYTVIGFHTEAALAALSLTDLVSLSQPVVGTELEKAKILRNYVNQNISIGVNSQAWTHLSPKNRFMACFVYRTEPVICGGMAILYRDLLTEFGIQSRFVYMWLEGLVDSHVSVEVNINGKWIASDPTYNFVVRSKEGVLLQYEEMRTIPWDTDHEGTTFRHRMNYITYPYPYSSYLRHIAYVPIPPV